jgi:hypothetical protein
MSEVIDVDNIKMQIHNASERVESDNAGKKAAKAHAISGDESGSADAVDGSLPKDKKDKKKLDPKLVCNKEQCKDKPKHLKKGCWVDHPELKEKYFADKKAREDKGASKAAVAAVASSDSSQLTSLFNEKFKAQEDRMEELLKRSSATGSLSRVAGDSADTYGGSIWAMRCSEIHPNYTTLMEDNESLVVAPQACPTVSFGSIASSRSVGAMVTFEIDSDATHNMHGNVEFCHTALDNFDPSRRMRIEVANGGIIYAEGCGRLTEGGLLTKDVWCVPSIGNRGLLSTWPCTNDEGVECTLGGPNQLVFKKDGKIIAKGFKSPSTRNHKIQFALRDRSHDPPSGHARGVSLPNLPIKARVELLHSRLNHMGSVRMYHLIKKGLSLRLPVEQTEVALTTITAIDCEHCGVMKA